ncbi:hypothetical protein SY83_13240 [Paenibacillus swuensis]|uniref:Protein SprT-like n=1 Tax=Paenibacillus swuensis TaxID=1178515 RepID=A0A172TJ51_9BACL|nr:SprT family protein [Paenibacillus swuensis]ANE47071.1 hypothetical protein SY83_13240 [Paenibacillus swuensis]
MEHLELQAWVERISLAFFGRPFLHRATFNARLRSTGGRYFLRSHNIEISPRQLDMFGVDEVEKIIKHELCHYHLHLMNKGYRHRDSDFKRLLAEVGGSRFCQAAPGVRRVEPYRYKLVCASCGTEFMRKRSVNVHKYGCGKCRGKLVQTVLDSV